MTVSEWDECADTYSRIQDSRRNTVFAWLRGRLQELVPDRVLDYGAGDGAFAALCADLPIKEIVTYDPAPNMVRLAAVNCGRLTNVTVSGNTAHLRAHSFDVVTMNAVWMCLRTDEMCERVLLDVRRLLKPHGVLVASVTHPCFRDRLYSTYQTDFDMRDYLRSGVQFRVHIDDGKNDVWVTDTHWSLSAMSIQLKRTGFRIVEISEFTDADSEHINRVGSPWMVLTATRT